jgi:hypothetical protein
VGKTKKRKRTHIKKKELNITDKRKRQNEDKVGLKKLPTYKTLDKLFQKTPNTEIPTRNSSLLSKPLVLFKTIFRG